MKRVRWMRAEWPISIRALAASMKRLSFTPDSFDGFVIERVRENHIEANYIEKLLYQETVTDPFGNEEVFDRISYRSIEFSLFSDFPSIELLDSHRNAKEFLSKLQELCDFSVTLSPLSVDLLEWIDKIQEQCNKELIVDSLQVSGLELERGINAKILVRGDKDVREALDAITKRRKFALERVQVRVPSDAGLIPIQLGATGTAKIPLDHVDEYLSVLRTSLPDMRKSAPAK